ncbi:unnamed protein product [Rangifer tarandus platyrhynchus]|uniref:Uncharacterized protein n=1 Tax=Rangifer tarandus platyrhynchus TaxID=3082113 RepID=A0ABN8ZD49_RANTA|nr:unnamed protein product [Rangifer tarandus platyrhynchus]
MSEEHLPSPPASLGGCADFNHPSDRHLWRTYYVPSPVQLPYLYPVAPMVTLQTWPLPPDLQGELPPESLQTVLRTAQEKRLVVTEVALEVGVADRCWWIRDLNLIPDLKFLSKPSVLICIEFTISEPGEESAHSYPESGHQEDDADLRVTFAYVHKDRKK